MEFEGLDVVVCVLFIVLGFLIYSGNDGLIVGLFGTALGSYFTYKTLRYKTNQEFNNRVKNLKAQLNKVKN